MILNTIVFDPVRVDYLDKAIETLLKYTDMKNWRIIVVDQTKMGLSPYVKKNAHLYMKPHRNLGFAKSMNEGIIHGLHWKSKYITCANDDIEFINNDWWKGITKTFEMDENIYAVNPESPRVPLWGASRRLSHHLDQAWLFVSLLASSQRRAGRDHQPGDPGNDVYSILESVNGGFLLLHREGLSLPS